MPAALGQVRKADNTLVATIMDDNTFTTTALLDTNSAIKAIIADLVAFGVPGELKADGSYYRQRANDAGVVKAEYMGYWDVEMKKIKLIAVAT